MFAFLRFGGLRQSFAFDMREDGDWMSGFLKALHARLMARIAEWKETYGEVFPPPKNPQGDEGQAAAFKGTGEESQEEGVQLLIVPLPDPVGSTAEGAPPLEDFQLVFESPDSGTVDLASVFAPFSSQVDLDGLIMQLSFTRPPADILVPDLPG